MGRHPNNGGPVFRFIHDEVTEMEACLQGLKNAIPAREMICALAEKFSSSPIRTGKIVVQPKQVWNWFQNRRYSQRGKVRTPGNLNVPTLPQVDCAQLKTLGHQHVPIPQERNSVQSSQLEFEAKSARDGAWYDVSLFLSQRRIETNDPEVRVRFSGFSVEDDEWINVLRCVRRRSLPCENVECIALLPGDLILCFQPVMQEGKEQALYFDARILDAQRRRHDVRGCRCRFLVRYVHDQSEEIVPLRKLCRRPETDHRLGQLHALRASGSADERPFFKIGSSKDQNLMPQRIRKQSKVLELKTEIAAASLQALAVQNAGNKEEAQNDHMNASVLMAGNFGKVPDTVEMVEV